jgi:hypothetical protein
MQELKPFRIYFKADRDDSDMGSLVIHAQNAFAAAALAGKIGWVRSDEYVSNVLPADV